MKTNSQFHRFAQALLFYTLLVILWGAWVRISHSGDGCGASWPLCNGQIIPEAEHQKTWVEFSHRLTSGLFGIFVVYMFWQGRKFFDRQAMIRKALLATLIFTITEALLGAKLVLFGLVGNNDSVFRLLVMGLHQVNSLMLSGSVALVALYAGELPQQIKDSVSSRRPLPKWAFGFLVLFISVAITGGFAALFEGITKDFAPDAHYLLRLRISHPILATLIGSGLAIYFWLRAQEEKTLGLRKVTIQVAMIFAVGVVFGYITLFSLAPIWMKIMHLLIAHLIWIALVRWYFLRSLVK
jgi:cytochrome c oxidase assembly protein subunit 15